MAPTTKILSHGSRLVEKLKTYWFGKKIEEPPAISIRTAFLCAVLFTVFYIAPFYISSTLRTSPLSSRDAPAVIQGRIRAVGLSCLASSLVAVYIIVHFGHAGVYDVLRLLGLWPIDPLDILKALALVSILFAGPLYETIVVDGGWRAFNFRGLKTTFFDSWIAFRNNFISPISEELVFRSLVISLYLLAKVAPSRIVFTTPLIFGLAHVHHFVEFVQSRLAMNRPGSTGRIVLMGVVRSLFMLTYTSLFGFFAAFVHLRTGNLLAAIITHMFCNVMGLPRLWGKVGQDQDFRKLTPDVAQGKRDDTLEAQSRSEAGIEMTSVHGGSGPNKISRDLGVQWTIVYYVLLFAGAYGFYRELWVLTESKNALATYWKFV